ncbi:hypothetical protein FERRO_04700 [Ferrovum sp. JA12]|uniref:DUF4390 domain-containing protein n=1 Tax=Ferrovum sp. JA12 TaxID=1356299 RepID=UPI000712EE8B|nr:DUF4390 domain-containing protein [Ferrovum sp. JA12]KRH79405.1 hypothetical protein FERRO_04700 [Ferrovum sp. JA12]HQT82243.1 DUF4390 domain-containing protein [Ferrovaceae bacterium]HQU07300.1 DUF4390 domain-containing protein [Ferrovaceae bacterium]
MRYVKKIKFFIVLLLSCISLNTLSEGINIDSSTVSIDYQKGLINARYSVQLNPTLEQALNRGIPLFFNLSCGIIQTRWYWFNKKIYSSEQERKLTFNPLTRSYRFYLGSVYVTYNSLSEALLAVGQVSNWVLGEGNLLKKGEAYQATLQLKLDVSQLPKPFQIDAIANTDWTLSSTPYQWIIKP